MKPLFQMSERERAKALALEARAARLAEFVEIARRKYPGKSEFFYNRMAVRKLVWEDLKW